MTTNNSSKNSDNKDNDSNDVELPLIAHLKELRDRILRCLYAVVAIFLGLFYFSNDIYSFVSKPMRDAMPADAQMIAFEVASPFLAPFKLTLWVSFMLAMPVILYQVWSFIAPALYRKEKRIAIPLFISSVFLFYSGLVFAYFIVFELVFGFFISVVPDGIQIAPDINAYLSFALKIFLAFGLAFEIPVATVLLIWAGMISPEGLANKRPYIIVGCFIVAMLLTPADVFSMVLLAIPMWLLFEIGVYFGRWVTPVENNADENTNENTANNT